jgi:hypothetical protein
VSPMQALIILVAIVPIIAGLIVLSQVAGVGKFLFVGFVFVLYWTGIKAMAPAEFVPSLAGALGGLALAYLIHALPPAFGLAGVILVAAAILLAIYLLVLGRASVLINNAFMLVLTVATCSAFKTDRDYAAAAIAIIISALYAGGLVFGAKAMSSRRAKAVA